MAVTTVDFMAKEINNLHDVVSDLTLDLLRSLLVKEQISGDRIDTILSELKMNDLLSAAFKANDGVLRSQHCRQQFYKENFR